MLARKHKCASPTLFQRPKNPLFDQTSCLHTATKNCDEALQVVVFPHDAILYPTVSQFSPPMFTDSSIKLAAISQFFNQKIPPQNLSQIDSELRAKRDISVNDQSSTLLHLIERIVSDDPMCTPDRSLH